MHPDLQRALPPAHLPTLHRRHGRCICIAARADTALLFQTRKSPVDTVQQPCSHRPSEVPLVLLRTNHLMHRSDAASTSRKTAHVILRPRHVGACAAPLAALGGPIAAVRARPSTQAAASCGPSSCGARHMHQPRWALAQLMHVGPGAGPSPHMTPAAVRCALHRNGSARRCTAQQPAARHDRGPANHPEC